VVFEGEFVRVHLRKKKVRFKIKDAIKITLSSRSLRHFKNPFFILLALLKSAVCTPAFFCIKLNEIFNTFFRHMSNNKKQK